MKTLFVTATGQTEANYYTIWHLFRSQTNIEKIVVLSTDFTRKKNLLSNLMELLNLLDTGIHVEELHLPDGIEEKSISDIKAVIYQWIDNNQPKEIIFNVTGGTKLISFAQDQIAANNPNYSCVYQSWSNNQLVWYNTPDKPLEDIILPENIAVRLKGHGYDQISSETAFLDLPIEQYHYIAQLYKLIKIDFTKAQRLVSYLNYLVSSFDQEAVSYPYCFEIKKEGSFLSLAGWIKTLAQAAKPFIQLESLDDQKSKITFMSKEAAEFIGGKWFEVLVGFLITAYYQKKQTLVNIQIGLTFAKSSDGNEIDVAYLLKGHFYWMECKTVNWLKKNAPTTEVNNNLHKLSSISQGAGLNSHKFFVSLYDISEQSRKVAEDLGVIVIAGTDLFKFDRFLGEVA
ncbi:Card1-like endonuclease domain-containing protein [Psychrobacter lutiphocae]|uniref:Card1-like endonuclease domain-containing protein n=1 Tax=Psychrobacter lutiphocae TaxID=540500 RepID=UPI001919664D|nr:DUF1887 family CARF protein [Psychrobacter lutiphocae]